MLLRTMVAGDLEAVLAIERAATEYPWSAAQFSSSAGDDCTVLEVDNVVTGFSIFQRILDESSLLNIAVHPDHQGSGGGRLLLEQGIVQQARAGAMRCLLEVRESNVRAQGLYQALGFRQVGERKNYYPKRDGREMAIVLCRELASALLNDIECWSIT